MDTYLLRGIDPKFWRRVKAKAALQGISLKALILKLLAQWLAAVVVLLTGACGGAPLAPSAAVRLPIVLSGQSNALPDHLGGFLTAAYAPGVTVVAQGSTTIDAWNTDGPLWTQLAPTLTRPLAAFVWWQGESDAFEGGEHYAADLRALLARVRVAAGTPHLRIVIVKILPYVPPPPQHDATLVRAAEEAYVASDPDSVLIRIDDLPTDGYNHSTAYPVVTDRILAALR